MRGRLGSLMMLAAMLAAVAATAATAAMMSACGMLLGIGPRDDDDDPPMTTITPDVDGDALSGRDGNGSGDGGSPNDAHDDEGASPSLDKIVFLTKEGWGVSKQIGGEVHRPAADALCNLEGHENGMNPGREFVAWLSTQSASAISRLTGGRWVLPDKRVVFSEQIKIQNGPEVAIDQHADGTLFVPSDAEAPDQFVWTGTFENGTFTGDDCLDWTAQSAYLATTGVIGSTDAKKWTNASKRLCESEQPVICFQK